MMAICKLCNKVTSSNKSYCSNACKQKAYRKRRNVTPKNESKNLNINTASIFEYEIIVAILESKYMSYLKPTYLEYSFVRFYHPEVQKISPFIEQLIMVKKALNNSFSNSPYIIAFNKFLQYKIR